MDAGSFKMPAELSSRSFHCIASGVSLLGGSLPVRPESRFWTDYPDKVRGVPHIMQPAVGRAIFASNRLAKWQNAGDGDASLVLDTRSLPSLSTTRQPFAQPVSDR